MKRIDAGIKHGWRSGFEKNFAEELAFKGVSFEFEGETLPFVQPEKIRKYTPDFRIETKSGKIMYLETKGRLVTADRMKHLMIKQCHPHLDIRFVFQNPNSRITKVSKTTYANWCDANGFKWAKKTLPDEWLEEINE